MSGKQLAKGLTLSTVGLLTLLASESFVSTPYLPNKYDRPTIGYGSTFYEDGTPVRLDDPSITKERALEIAGAHIGKDEDVFKKLTGDVYLSQTEYDVYIDFMYQYGSATWAKSGMLRKLKAGDHKGACANLLEYRKIRIYPKNQPSYLYDCSTPNNRICRGVWTRQLERYNKCLSAQ